MELKGNSLWRVFIFLLLLTTPRFSYTQKLDEEQWEKLRKELDYSDVEKQQKPEVVEEKNISTTSSWQWGNLANVIVIIAVSFIIILFILRLLGVKSLNSKVKQRVAAFKLSEQENEAGLENLLPLHEQLLASGDYKGAIRTLYLQSLKRLHDAGQITWKKDKTNADYLREMRLQPEFKLFRVLTQSFEIAWYGEFPVSAEAYQSVKSHFDKLNTTSHG